MKNSPNSILFPRQLAMLALASAIAIPMWSQQDQVSTGISAQSTPPSVAQDQPSPTVDHPLSAPKEGFWGRVNPFARKSWVKRQTDPINDRLSELDELNAKNARDIRDVDSRAQAGIRRAQSSADSANQSALAANTQAQNASNTAQSAAGHVNRLNDTVSGLDQYRQVNEITVTFRAGTAVLTADSRTALDQLAANLAGRQGYILEMDAHAPAAGTAGIQNSERLAEAVKRYLLTEHQIPVYRMHSVALGNEALTSASGEDQKPERVRTSSVHLRLMENSLAARADATPQSASPAAGAEQP